MLDCLSIVYILDLLICTAGNWRKKKKIIQVEIKTAFLLDCVDYMRVVFGVGLFILKRQRKIKERVAHFDFNIYVYVCIPV